MKKVLVFIFCWLISTNLIGYTKEIGKIDTLAPITYHLTWLGIPMGSMTLKIEETTFKNTPCYLIEINARLNRLFSKLYPVSYLLHSYIKKEAPLTMRFVKRRCQENKCLTTSIDFDHKSKVITVEDNTKREVYPLSPADTTDILGALQLLRMQRIEEEKEFNFSVFYNSQYWKVTAKRGKAFAKELHKKGVFCVIPVFIQSKLINQLSKKTTELTILFSCDKTRLPIEFSIGKGIKKIYGRI